MRKNCKFNQPYKYTRYFVTLHREKFTKRAKPFRRHLETISKEYRTMLSEKTSQNNNCRLTVHFRRCSGRSQLRRCRSCLQYGLTSPRIGLPMLSIPQFGLGLLHRAFPSSCSVRTRDSPLYYLSFYYFTQVSEVKIQYSMPSGQVGLVMPSGDCQQ